MRIMKKSFSPPFLLLPPIASAQKASITINTVYGSQYDPGSKYAKKDGFDIRYIDAVKELKIDNTHWPVGNRIADYHWMDGIGTKTNGLLDFFKRQRISSANIQKKSVRNK